MTNVMFDIAEREIKVGDWIAQSYSLGRCPALKISKVMAFTDKGKIRVTGFERHENYWVKGEREKLQTPIIEWSRSGPYVLAFPERMVVIDQPPNTLLDHIEKVYGGDPFGVHISEI